MSIPSSRGLTFLSVLVLLCVSGVHGQSSWGAAAWFGPSEGAVIVESVTTFIAGVVPPVQAGVLALWPGVSNSSGSNLIQTVILSQTSNSWCGAASNQWCVCASVFTGTQISGPCVPISATEPITIKYVLLSDNTNWLQNVTNANTGALLSSLTTPSGPYMLGWGTAQECQDYCNGTVTGQLYKNTVITLSAADTHFGSTAGNSGATMVGVTSSQGGKVWSVSEIYAPAMVPGIYTQPLDLIYSVNAAAAFSTRLLTLNYQGKALKVRRSSDGATEDIGFTATGLLDTVTLLSFVGSGNQGYVTVWYDQSGNGNNAVQATAAQQPLIVSGGSLVMIGNHPTLLFTGANSNYLSLSSYPFQGAASCAAYAVNSVRTVQSWQRYFDFGSGVVENFFATPTSPNTFRITTNNYNNEQGDAGQLLSTTNSINLAQFHHQGVSAAITASTTLSSTTLTTSGVQTVSIAPSALNGVTNNYIGRSQYPADPYFDGYISELVFYAADPLLTASAEVSNFVQNIRTFYAF